jgi:hypothetical protein
MTLKTWRAASLALALAAVGATAASAHHSFSMFDSGRTVTLEGAVKQLQWTNPHVWVELVVTDASGRKSEWSVEGPSANTLARQGWSRSVMKPGDKAVIVVHPLKDGSNGGSLVSATVNGQPVGAQG